MKKIIFICALLICKISAIIDFQIPKPKAKINVTVAVIIPCYHGHFKHLEELLNEYCKQTVLPEEIIISLSEANKINAKDIQTLREHNWPFKLKLLTTNNQQFAGANRNMAAKATECDVIICQDADDVPHAQRVAIIKHAFENYKVDIVQHYYTRNPKNISQTYSLKEIFKKTNKKLSVTNGNIAISRKLFEEIKWSNWNRGQDVDFNVNAFNKGYKRHVITLPLLLFRKEYSSISYIHSLKKKSIK